MSLADVITEVGNITGVAATTQIRSAVAQAAKEFYAAVDFPGELQETRIKVYEDGVDTRHATLPYTVNELRKIKSPAGRFNVIYGTNVRNYEGWVDIQKLWEVRLVRVTPLLRRITNATPLTFTRKLADTTRVVLHVGGVTDVANYEQQELVIEAGQREVTTPTGFTDVRMISKTVAATSDIIVTDADGTELTYLPNDVLSARYKMFQFRGPEIGPVDLIGGVYDILYKPSLPEITEDLTYFPTEFEYVLVWLACSHIYHSQEDKISQGSHYRKLAQEVLVNLMANTDNGKDYKRPSSPNLFATRQWYARV